MDSGLDAKHFIHLPGWAKALCLGTLALGIVASLTIIFEFFGAEGNRDWVLIGFSGAQFLITSFVIAIILFVSQTDANIGTLRRRSEQFLIETLPIALGRISLEDHSGSCCEVKRGTRSDIFGYDYSLQRGGTTVLRLWCGVNVGRIIVIYRFTNPQPAVSLDAFVERLKQIFRFSLGGAASVGYNVSFEPLPGKASIVSVWLTVATAPDFLTDPALKLFWSQDIAMMTESLMRTALRHGDEVTPDTKTLPLPQ
ncbi:hypothetical protein BH09PSE4_BH09PSE4_07020 [soil metagenome]